MCLLHVGVVCPVEFVMPLADGVLGSSLLDMTHVLMGCLFMADNTFNYVRCSESHGGELFDLGGGMGMVREPSREGVVGIYVAVQVVKEGFGAACAFEPGHLGSGKKAALFGGSRGRHVEEDVVGCCGKNVNESGSGFVNVLGGGAGHGVKVFPELVEGWGTLFGCFFYEGCRNAPGEGGATDGGQKLWAGSRGELNVKCNRSMLGGAGGR
jgi:hypothetical protein